MLPDDDRRVTRRYRAPRGLPVAAFASLLVCSLLFFGRFVSSLKRRSSFETIVALPSDVTGAWHAVIVAGHAVFKGRGEVENEAAWHLEPFQRGQLATMLRHVRRGVEVAARDNDSLLIFSGGETRAEAGPRSEASSYWWVAEANGWFGYPSVRARAVLERYARDSFENLMFPLCRHKEVARRYPSKITIISFAFKRHRFTHRPCAFRLRV